MKRKPNPVHPLIERLADPVYLGKILAIWMSLLKSRLLKERKWLSDQASYISLDYGAGGQGIPFKNPNAELDVESLLDCVEGGRQ